MNAFDQLGDLAMAALDRLEAAGKLPPGLPRERILVEPPRDPAHGHAALNAALVLAKPAGRRPMDLAQALADDLRGRGPVVDAVAAPPGFVNLTLMPGFWLEQLGAALAAGARYGRCDQGRGRAINVEYCSANPTGLLHVGHGRGTVFGDALATLLERAGWVVTREYVVNDRGAQIERLARSIHHRYLEALGQAAGPLPEGLYPLPELVPVAQAIAARDGPEWVEAGEAAWLERFGQEGVAVMLGHIKADLAALGVHHDVFTSERAIVAAGGLERILAQLTAADLIYKGTLPAPKGKPVDDWEPAPQLLFRATAYGDEIDRPLQRANGAWTYFAADIAYHADKVARGFAQMCDVWGADHGGYVKRMQAAVAAISAGSARLDVRLCQLVNLMDAGQPLKMSKRAGRTVTLRDVVEEVGAGPFRFMMLTRKNDAPLDFDLAAVKEQSKDNPVFYVQYAHARVRSVQRAAAEAGLAVAAGDPPPDLTPLSDPAEAALIRLTTLYPRLLAAAAEQREPHRIAFYLQELAAALHGHWALGRERPELRFLQPELPALSRARLALLEAVRLVLAAGLGIIGVEPAEEMH